MHKKDIKSSFQRNMEEDALENSKKDWKFQGNLKKCCGW